MQGHGWESKPWHVNRAVGRTAAGRLLLGEEERGVGRGQSPAQMEGVLSGE